MEIDAERTKILLWLSEVAYATYHPNAQKGHVKGTGEWLFRGEGFRRWQPSSASTILWLYGIRKIFSLPPRN